MKKPTPTTKRTTKQPKKVLTPALSRKTNKLKSATSSQPTRRTSRQSVRTSLPLHSPLSSGKRLRAPALKRKKAAIFRKVKRFMLLRQFRARPMFVAPRDLVPTHYHRYGLSYFDAWYSPKFRKIAAFRAPVFVASNARCTLRNKKFLSAVLVCRTVVSRSQTRRRIRAVVRWHGRGHLIVGARRPYTRLYSHSVLRAPLQQAVFTRESLLRRRGRLNTRLRMRPKRGYSLHRRKARRVPRRLRWRLGRRRVRRIPRKLRRRLYRLERRFIRRDPRW